MDLTVTLDSLLAALIGSLATVLVGAGSVWFIIRHERRLRREDLESAANTERAASIKLEARRLVSAANTLVTDSSRGAGARARSRFRVLEQLAVFEAALGGRHPEVTKWVDARISETWERSRDCGTWAPFPPTYKQKKAVATAAAPLVLNLAAWAAGECSDEKLISSHRAKRSSRALERPLRVND